MAGWLAGALFQFVGPAQNLGAWRPLPAVDLAHSTVLRLKDMGVTALVILPHLQLHVASRPVRDIRAACIGSLNGKMQKVTLGTNRAAS